MPGELERILRDKYYEAFPQAARQLDDFGALDSHIEELENSLRDQIELQRKRIVLRLEDEDPRMLEDFEYRARMHQWSLNAAREGVISGYFDSLPDTEN